LIKAWINYEIGNFSAGKPNYRKVVEFNKKYYIEHFPFYSLDYEFYCGLCDLGIGQIDSAKTRLENIKIILPDVLPLFKYLANYRHNILYTKILFAEKNYSEVINFSKNTPSVGVAPWIGSWILTHENMPAMQDELARAYYKKGLLAKAISTYEDLIKIKKQEQVRDLIHPIYHFRLAELYEEDGDLDKAVDKYEKFLELWKDADEDLPEPKVAKTKLKELRKR
jgi:tetratricopeptide (TPR) repeat protein